MCAHWMHMHTFKHMYSHMHEFMIIRTSSYPQQHLYPFILLNMYMSTHMCPAMQISTAVHHNTINGPGHQGSRSSPTHHIPRPVLRLSGWSDQNGVVGWGRESEVISGEWGGSSVSEKCEMERVQSRQKEMTTTSIHRSSGGELAESLGQGWMLAPHHAMMNFE